MIFTETELKGAFIIEIEKINDERGFFARSFCKKEFISNGLSSEFVQCNISFNKEKGTLRGMHYQAEPSSEAKLVRCFKGSIYDVIIDLRQDSPTYCNWISIELNDKDYKSLYIPKGFAHGFLTLEDNTEVFYQMSEFYAPNSAKGIMWNDPFFNIKWPEGNFIISDKDNSYDKFYLNE